MPESEAFDLRNPPKRITNPSGAGSARHVYKYGEFTLGPKPTSLPVAWKDGVPIMNTYREVNSPEELAKAKADGWSETPVLTEPKGKAKD